MAGRDTLPSRLGLGTSRIGSFNNPASLRDSERLVRGALDMGVRVIDTANIYGQGDSERTIGRALAGRRDEAFVVTKGARSFSGKYRLVQPLKPLLRSLLNALGKGREVATARRGEALTTDWTPAAIVASLEASLQRLRTDRVDAYLLHSPPPEVAADPDVHRALEDLRRAGKAVRVGMSCDDLATLAAALDEAPLDLVQLPWDAIAAMGAMGDRLRARGTLVLAREVIALQGHLTPEGALRRSLAHRQVDCTLVGTTRLGHLQAAQRVAEEEAI